MVHYMMSCDRRALRVLALCGLVSALLCLPGGAAPAKKAVQKTPSAPLNLSGAGTGLVVYVPDPKLPGKLMAVVKAVGAEGQSAANGFLGNMTQVSALFYQQGKPAATFHAPSAHGGSRQKALTITGTGGVVVKSLIQPGTTLTADTIVWYADKNKIVATGHVVFHDGKTGTTVHSPAMIADTKLNSIQTPRGHLSGVF